MSHAVVDEIPVALQARPSGRALTFLLLALIIAGIAARFALLSISIGSFDAALWERMASRISQHGLYETYRQDPWMNHPPLSGLWAAWVWEQSQRLGVPFAQLYKLPVVLSDCVTCWLIWNIWKHRGGARQALLAAAVFAWSVPAILISAHHCNCDSALAMFALLSFWLVEIRKAPLLAGLALGAAINLKLTAALMLVPLLLGATSRRELLRLLLGLAIMSTPFLYVWWELGGRFRRNVLGYDSAGSGWGLHNIFDLLSNHPVLKSYFDTVAENYRRSGGPVVMLCALAATLRLVKSGVRDRFLLAGLVVAVYAAVTPALAAQHRVLPAVFLLACSIRAGFIWSALNGLALFTTYFFEWDGMIPIRDQPYLYKNSPAPVFNALAWGWVVAYTWWLLRSHSKQSPGSKPSGVALDGAPA